VSFSSNVAMKSTLACWAAMTINVSGTRRDDPWIQVIAVRDRLDPLIGHALDDPEHRVVVRPRHERHDEAAVLDPFHCVVSRPHAEELPDPLVDRDLESFSDDVWHIDSRSV